MGTREREDIRGPWPKFENLDHMQYVETDRKIVMGQCFEASMPLKVIFSPSALDNEGTIEPQKRS